MESSTDSQQPPSYWKTNTIAETLGSQRITLEAGTHEFKDVKRLVLSTWIRREGEFRDADGKNLKHAALKVIKIERIQNPLKFEKYKKEKEAMIKAISSSTFKALPTPKGRLGPVMTTKCLETDSFLLQNINLSVSEHYLFHGTKEGNVSSIVESGFCMERSRDRSLLGRALYFAESSTKADFYADERDKRTDGHKHMFLGRVLLGDPYLHTNKKKTTYTRPPYPHHSIIGDSGRPFRIFAIFKSTQSYPEYLITYRRLSVSEVEAEDKDN